MPTKNSVVRAVRLTKDDNDKIEMYITKYGCTFNHAMHLIIGEVFGDYQISIADFIDMSGEKSDDTAEKRYEYEALRTKLPELLGRKCRRCGSSNNIEYHHIKPLSMGGSNDLENLIPLCVDCHDYVHSGKTRESDKKLLDRIAELENEIKEKDRKIAALKSAIVALGE